MVKTNKKSLIAMIAMVVLLIASIAMGITGAWFTDRKEGTGAQVNFGTVIISDSNGAVTLTKADSVAMPGDTLTLGGEIINGGTAKVWVRYKVSHTYTTEDALKTELDKVFSGQYVYVETAVEAGKNSALTGTVTIPTSLGNSVQDASFSVSVTMEALQWANTADTCQAAFTAAGYETTAVAAK